MKAIIGYHGKGNFGDDLILKEYLELNKKDSYLLFSYGEALIFDNVIETVFWSNNKYKNIYKFILAMLKCEQIIWVGGTCFSEEDGIGGFNYMMVSLLLLKKITYEYIGINRLFTFKSKFKAKLLLTNSTKIICRDNNSIINYHEIVGDIGDDKRISQRFDLGDAYLMKVKGNYENRKNGGYLLLAWRDLTNYSCFDDLAYYELQNAMKLLNKSYKSIIIIDTDDSLDSTISSKLFLDLNDGSCNVEYRKELNVLQKLELVAEASLIVTSRLHIAVAGGIFSVPTIAFNYSSKMEYLQSESNYRLISEEELKSSSLYNLAKELC
jgi:polysaccharide pyruvyl transferase WcaK-like protein